MITGIHKTNPVAVFFTSLIWPENVIEAFLVLQDMMFKAIKDWMIINGIKKKKTCWKWEWTYTQQVPTRFEEWIINL